MNSDQSGSVRYPLLAKAIEEGRIDSSSRPDPSKRMVRCYQDDDCAMYACIQCGGTGYVAFDQSQLSSEDR